MKRFSQIFLGALLSGATTLGAYKLLFDDNGKFSLGKSPITTLATNSYAKKVGLSPEVLDFTEAAEKTIHPYVHVKNVSYKTVTNPMLEYYYGYKGGQTQEQVGTGSGVVISEEGITVRTKHAW